ncbi:MAG: M13 family metallopeptidase [Deltaproteobacteria bacterium]|nr:M13 family metallopeptidase [Deltaproteobacteria bacterium]
MNQCKSPGIAALVLLLPVLGVVAVLQQRAIMRQSRAPSAVDNGILDRSADPCTDFYQYACGGWLARTEIPDDRPQWSRGFGEIDERNLEFLNGVLSGYSMGIPAPENPFREKLGDFYAVCMDEAKAETASLATLNAWSRDLGAMADKHGLAPLLAQLHLAGTSAFFSLGPEQDLKNPEQMIAAVDQDGLGLPDRDYYLSSDPNMIQVRRLYRDYIKTMFTLWAGDKRAPQSSADAVLNIETRLAQASLPRVERRDPVKVYHRLEKAGLQKRAPEFSWQEYFDSLGYSAIQALDVKTPAFFSGLNTLLNDTSLVDLRTYLRWQLLAASTPTLGKRFVDEQFRFSSKALSGQRRLKPRWKRCVGATEGALGFALARSFVQVKYAENSKALSREMIRNVEKAFAQSIEQADWMDSPTKAEARKKLARIFNKVGYPDHWRSYDGLAIDRQSYLGNQLAANVFNSRYELNKIGKAVDRAEWEMAPTAVNAYYDASMNEMVFPAGIFQTPFFDSRAASFDNYSGIGMVMGHELTHGFDDEGRKFDADGKLRDWWSELDTRAFDSRTQCVVRQYAAYPLPQGLHVNGKLTNGENIADLGGIKTALSAWRSSQGAGTTDTQPQERDFFLHFAQSWCTKTKPELERMLVTVDVHSPPRLRVNLPLANLPEFAAAFGCAVGSRMNASERCKVW